MVATDIVQLDRGVGTRSLDFRICERRQYMIPSRNRINIPLIGDENINSFVIFICGLFNDAASGYDCVASKDGMVNVQ